MRANRGSHSCYSRTFTTAWDAGPSAVSVNEFPPSQSVSTFEDENVRFKIYLSIFVLIPIVSVRADDSQQLLLETMKAVSHSASCFDNVQAEYHEEKNVKDSNAIVTNRFWSRDGKYFRIDTMEEKKGNFEVKQRIVVRPEGFVKMDREPNSGRLVITDFGTEEEGLWDLYGYQFFRSSIRGDFALLDQVNNDEKLKLEDVLLNGTETTVRFIGLSPEDSSTFVYEYVIDSERGVCVKWSASVFKDGVKVGGATVVKEYSNEITDLCPVKLKAVYENYGNYSFTSTRTKFKMEPAPLGLFDLGIQGHTSSRVWYRRFLLFLVIVLGVGGWLVSKYRKGR